MSVYMVMNSYYGERFVVGVFASRELAESYMDKFPGKEYELREAAIRTALPEEEINPIA
ncbi:MAG: hypothetical protein P4N41_06880 [Negativicutes bacterium]|nr:hypothetical protein [Negativicutes bacterium]